MGTITKPMTISGDSASYTVPASYAHGISNVILRFTFDGITSQFGVSLSGNGSDNGSTTLNTDNQSADMWEQPLDENYGAGDSISVDFTFSNYWASIKTAKIQFDTEDEELPYIKYNGNKLYAVTYMQIEYSASLSGTYYIKNDEGSYDEITLPSQWAPTNIPYYQRIVSPNALYKR